MARRNRGIRRRGVGRYEYQFTHDGRRYSVSGSSPDECKRRAREKIAALEKGAIDGGGLLTLDEYFNEWIEARALMVKPATIFNYKSIYYSNISPFLGRRELWSITRHDVKRLMSELLALEHRRGHDGVAATNHARLLLGSILKTAAADEIIEKNPAAGVPFLRKTTPPARETIHRELSDDEIAAFLEAARGSRYYNVFRFLLNTGCRVGECLALEWRDIDTARGVIHIARTMTHDAAGKVVVGDTPKTRSSKRNIPINGPIREILGEQRPAGKVFSMRAPVFPNVSGGHASPDTMKGIIWHIISRHNARGGVVLVPFGVHAFRDTFASRAIRAGVAPNTLKEILGHASLAITMDLYAHVSMDDKKQAMEKLAL